MKMWILIFGLIICLGLLIGGGAILKKLQDEAKEECNKFDSCIDIYKCQMEHTHFLGVYSERYVRDEFIDCSLINLLKEKENNK